MELTLYQIDAFAAQRFQGNPAAVVPLDSWLSDDQMQAIAAENNLSETVFYVANAHGYQIRWFTPLAEVELCGHATLAAAFVLFNTTERTTKAIQFDSLSGPLSVRKHEDWLSLNFPAQAPTPCATPKAIVDAFRVTPIACLKAEDYIVVFDNEAIIAAAEPDFEILKQLDLRGVAITAPSEQYDFVCRFFAPKFGIAEDPVTGSAFTQLIPYWAKQSGKTEFIARQVSSRGGDLRCELMGQRVNISGQAVKYLEGSIYI